jgi:predicted N-acetyltransferase YhbS
MAQTSIRKATKRDAPGLARVFNNAFGPTTPAQVRQWMSHKDIPLDILVAIVDGEIASTVTVEYRTFLVHGVPIRTGGIAGVATRWEYTRRGLAGRLMKEAHRRIRKKGISNAALYTSRSGPGIRIYSRLGYTETTPWRFFAAFHRPEKYLVSILGDYAKWLRRSAWGRSVARDWTARVLVAGRDWKVTLWSDGKEFHVKAGQHGSPTLRMRGTTQPLLESFEDRTAYDRHRRAERFRLAGGDAESRRKWRLYATRSWYE